jgi:hypothetical protein
MSTHPRRNTYRTYSTYPYLPYRVSLVGFQHALEHIDRGMLERHKPLDRFLLHVRRRATVTTANSDPPSESVMINDN